MKKKLLTLLLALILIVGSTSATQATIFEAKYDGTYTCKKLDSSITTYGEHYFNRGYAPVMVNGKWAYIDKDGKVASKLSKYASGFDFGDGGLAPVIIDGNVAYIDPNGSIKTNLKSDVVEKNGTLYISPNLGNDLFRVFTALGYDSNGMQYGEWSYSTSKGKEILNNLDALPDADELDSDTIGHIAIGADRESININGEEVSALFLGELALVSIYSGKNEGVYIVIKNHTETESKGIPSKSKVIIDGVEVNFDGYNIFGNNYFKLRDLAYALSGSNSPFDVTWYQETQSIKLLRNKPYTAVGGEMSPSDGLEKSLDPNPQNIYVNDTDYFRAFAYIIDNNNYFKLRDICDYFHIQVAFDPVTKVITLTTNGNDSLKGG